MGVEVLEFKLQYKNILVRPKVGCVLRRLHGSEGRGLVAFTLVGREYYPSAAYVVIDENGKVRNGVRVASIGKDPLDDFSGEHTTSTSMQARMETLWYKLLHKWL